MKNPLNKRLPRELKSDIGKYLVLFIFMTGMIGIVSGFFVSSYSISKTFNDSFEISNIEDGNFELLEIADSELIKSIEDENVKVYENFYKEMDTKEVDSTLRIFKLRGEINKTCLMEGEYPKEKDEICIDRVYAQNNDLEIGNTLSLGDKKYKICGFTALPDYGTLFENTSDMIFDAVKFGVALVTEDSFNEIDDLHLHYCYSWTYNNSPTTDLEKKNMSDDFLTALSQKTVLSNYIPQYTNQAINYAGNDLGNDNSIISAFLYITITIIAFVFAITTSNTITKESSVIGTLRATGYKRKELLTHYMTMPLLVIFVSAIVGNVLGYTFLKNYMAKMYYDSYSLPTFETLWNGTAFIKTTIVPLLIMTAINYLVLLKKLRLSPLRFLRHELSLKVKKKAFKLNTKIKIMHRYRLRIIFQNMPNYITIFIGIFFANFILLFGLMLPPAMDNNEKIVIENMLSDYQYILKAPAETKTDGVEKFSLKALKTTDGKLKSEDISIYGIFDNSNFINAQFSDDEVVISSAYAEKHDIKIGDTISVREPYENKEYSFKVSDTYYYPATLAIFTSQENFSKTFDLDSQYFNGYFSNTEITDIDNSLIATTITEDDMTKTSRQMKISLASSMYIFSVFGLIMFVLIIYLLSKIIIEKNAQSISMSKILGYLPKEINRLYVMTTTIIVLISIVATLPLTSVIMNQIFLLMFRNYSGWIVFNIPFWTYVEIGIIGVIAYSLVAFLQMRNVKKIKLADALKNVE